MSAKRTRCRYSGSGHGADLVAERLERLPEVARFADEGYRQAALPVALSIRSTDEYPR